ncbi:hypothetical protein AGOR_G00026360 [Albula goreensis]|uniref:Uncharacterized protein n=1 Tax=Albula goreensis TaxID=1534307 RepID=A0A8T3E6T8_9TELE|nr:hypothetical protein AGOR_G00026360 [Albula goreensis]
MVNYTMGRDKGGPRTAAMGHGFKQSLLHMVECRESYKPLKDPSYEAANGTGWSNSMTSGKGERKLKLSTVGRNPGPELYDLDSVQNQNPD